MANTQHLQKLKEGVAAWNEWRLANPDLLSPDLSGADLQGLDFSYANLAGVVLKRADLSDVNLSDANLQGFRKFYADSGEVIIPAVEVLDVLQNGVEPDVTVRGIELNSQIRSSKRLFTDLTQVNLRGANLQRTILCQCDFRDSFLQNVDLRNADLRQAHLTGLVLTGARVDNANFWGARLFGWIAAVDFSKAELTNLAGGVSVSIKRTGGNNISNGKHVPKLKEGVAAWNEWRLANPNIIPDLRGADLHGLDLRGANLGGADMSYADLTKADLSNTDLHGYFKFNLDSGSIIIDAIDWLDAIVVAGTKEQLPHINGTNISSYLAGVTIPFFTDFYKANLQEANFDSANLQNCNFRDANLRRVNLQKADLRQATFAGANLAEAKIEGANFRGATIFASWGGDLDFSQVDLRETWKDKLI